MSELESKIHVLVVEDDPAMGGLLRRILEGEGYTVELCSDGHAGVAGLARGPDVVVTDLRLPGPDGLEILRQAHAERPELPVIVITAFGSIPGAVDAMRLGAFDYLTKPLPDPDALRDVVRRAVSRGGQAVDRSDDAADSGMEMPGGVIAKDPVTLKAFSLAERAAPNETTVLLLGESGVGKEVFARFIHDHSERAKGPFVAINCAAVPGSLLESELFGHERGAFTGAVSRRVGRFEQADGGTLFLDEMGELNLELQPKLLRVLQEREVEPLGGQRRIKVNVRIVTATNRDLKTSIAAGTFREDLYYRLAVLPIEIPPLRERRGDILPLARHFLRVLSRGKDRSQAQLTAAAEQRLVRYRWPGNVRELQNVLERAYVLSGAEPIDVDALGIIADNNADNVVGQEVTEAGVVAGGDGDDGPAQTLKDMERQAIVDALAAEEGNRRRAAKRLGIALRTLQYKIKAYGLK